MNAKLAAAIEAAWSAAVLGAIALVFRREITTVLTNARADMNARARVVEAEAKRVAARRGFVDFLREHGIEPSKDELDCGGCPNA